MAQLVPAEMGHTSGYPGWLCYAKNTPYVYVVKSGALPQQLQHTYPAWAVIDCHLGLYSKGITPRREWELVKNCVGLSFVLAGKWCPNALSSLIKRQGKAEAPNFSPVPEVAMTLGPAQHASMMHKTLVPFNSAQSGALWATSYAPFRFLSSSPQRMASSLSSIRQHAKSSLLLERCWRTHPPKHHAQCSSW